MELGQSTSIEDHVAGLFATEPYEDDALFARVQSVMAPYPYVILILPSPDKEKSVKILNERTGGMVSEGFDFHEHFVTHHSNYDLAKHILYTEGKTPEETCAEIVEIVTSSLSVADQ